MPANGHTLGRDVSVVITTKKRGIFRPRTVTSFHSKPATVEIKVKPLNGKPQFATVPDGHEGGFEIERANADVETYFADKEAGYYDGEDEDVVEIHETIREVGGGISQWRYEGVALSLSDNGAKQADQTVKQKIDFKASTKVRVV